MGQTILEGPFKYTVRLICIVLIYQLILTGTTLQNDELLLTNVGLKEGSKLMLLGKKVILMYNNNF